MRYFVLILAALFYACSSGVQLTKPADLQDGINTGTVEQAGMDSIIIIDLLEKIDDGSFEGINSILVAKDNKLIVERYYNQVTVDSLQHLYSVGKSIVSLVIGITVDQGLIKNMDETLLGFFKRSYPYVQNEDKGKRNIKLKHLLSMTTGINIGDFRNGTDNTHKMLQRLNPLKYYLDLPMKYEPGEEFVYSDANPIITRAVINSATGGKYSDFEIKYLLDPLGITKINHYRDYRARDLIKFGLLVSNGGVWNGKRILSKEWIDESTSSMTIPNWSRKFADGYGYFWWIKNIDYKNQKMKCVIAAGNGHQFIYILPEINLVVLLTGSNFDRPDLNYQPYNIFYNYILSSLK